MILLIDNYDSFSYNLYQLVGSMDPDIRVVRNDTLTVAEIEALSPTAVILSPGPGRPEDAGVCMPLVQQAGGHLPILGVCLGHQAICAAYGATVSHAKHLMHGKQSIARLEPECRLFRGCPQEAPVARYHSLSVVESTLPGFLLPTARADDGEIMAVKHQNCDVYGVQFHPESFMTPDGARMLRNFLEIAKEKKA